MSIKIALLVSASVLLAAPDLAMARARLHHVPVRHHRHGASRIARSGPIIDHSNGPIPYSELQQIDRSGYNTVLRPAAVTG